ncbi:MAG: UrcA family protein [Alphaproteobacteria bacterium]|nr:UrcA family protein [Alphaproteobacteria bacterium]
MYRLLKISTAAIAIATFAQGACAQAALANDVVVKQVTVHYADLNINSEDGAAALQARIDQAASQACGGNPAFSSNYQMAPVFLTREYEQCRASAVDRAVAEVDAPLAHVAANAR